MAAIGWLLLSGGAVDQLFTGVLVLVLATAASYATIARPRLSADPDGIAVRGLRGARGWSWSEVTVEIRRTERLGRSVETLEIDIPNDKLIILGRIDLGVDPRDVADELNALRT